MKKTVTRNAMTQAAEGLLVPLHREHVPWNLIAVDGINPPEMEQPTRDGTNPPEMEQTHQKQKSEHQSQRVGAVYP
jgi:hypothetical protein